MTTSQFQKSLVEALPSADEEEVVRFQRSIGAILPKEYRDFLAMCNGGACGGRLRHVDFDVGVHHIGGLRSEPCLSLDRAHEVYKGRIPDELIWIMADSFGNALCLGVRHPYRGKIFFWDHEEEQQEDWDGKLSTATNVVFLADSLTQFIESLYERPNTAVEDNLAR